MAFSVLYVVRHKHNAHFKLMYQSAETSSLKERAKSSIGSHQVDSFEGVTYLRQGKPHQRSPNDEEIHPRTTLLIMVCGHPSLF